MLSTLSSSSRRSALGAALALGAAGVLGCGPGEAPRRDAPGAVRPRASDSAAAASPEEPGLTDLARLSRYVFREMQARGECAPEGPASGRLDYSLEITVEAGRISGVRLIGVSAELGGFAAPLLPERWPPSLVASIRCLEPHLEAVAMDAPPPDGVYESRFSLGGEAPPPAGPPAAAAAAELPDPAEPGLPDLQRVARHVFAEMHRVSGHCILRNPFDERLAYVVEVEVRGGAIARAAIRDARLERADATIPLAREAWPEDLERFAGCFVPHLEGLALEPAPADGVYDPDYAVRPER